MSILSSLSSLFSSKKKEKEVERWGGKDSKLIEEWKERNRERQNEDFKRLLKRRG